MEKGNSNPGAELLFLLRQQRYLYHQLKILAQRQRELAGTSSPELLLDAVSGRHKLVEKLRELDEKLRPIKANWDKLRSRIGAEHTLKAQQTANQIRQIINEIAEVAPPDAAANLPSAQSCRFDELFAESGIGQ